MGYLDIIFSKLGLLRRSEIDRLEKERELEQLRDKVTKQEQTISDYSLEMERSIEQATVDLRESLEQFEIQNVELSIAKRKASDYQKILETKHAGDVVLREINFQAEYKQAGISILSYFGRIIELKYPNMDVNVKIEQLQDKVRLIIETPLGEREVIEKLLSDYGEVINGQETTEPIFHIDTIALELKSELRIANARIENQKELLSYQKSHISDLKDLFGVSLTKTDNHVQHITLAPSFQNNNQIINVEQANKCKSEISDLLGILAKNYQGSNVEELERLNSLKHSLTEGVETQDKDEIKNSSWLNKLKEFSIDANNKASDVNDIFKSLSDGLDKAKKLATKYNAIAQWCGAPQIPTQLIE